MLCVRLIPAKLIVMARAKASGLQIVSAKK
jgi:hypothetical protein